MSKEGQLWDEVNSMLEKKRYGVVPDIPTEEATKELKSYIKSRKGKKARKTLALSGNFAFIGTRSVTDDPSKLRVYYLGPDGLRRTPKIDLQEFEQEAFKPDFLYDRKAKAKHAVEAFMNSGDGGHQARDLVSTLARRLKQIRSAQKAANGPSYLGLKSQIAA